MMRTWLKVERPPAPIVEKARKGSSTSTSAGTYSSVPVDYGKFEALHAAMWQGGAFLYVPKGVSVELPFR